MRSLHISMKSSPLLTTTREKPVRCNEDPAQPKINKQKMSGILRIWEALAMLRLYSRTSCHLGKVEPAPGGTQCPPPPGSSPSVLSHWVSHLPASLPLMICLVLWSVCVFHSCCRETKRPWCGGLSGQSVKKRVSLLPQPLGGWPRVGWYLSSEGPLCSALQPEALDCAPHSRLFAWALILLLSKLISPRDAGTKTLWSQDTPPQAYVCICYASYRMESVLGDHQSPRGLSPWHDTPPPIALLMPACSQQESPSSRKWIQDLRAISPEMLRYRLHEGWHFASDKRNVPMLRDREVILAYPWVYLNSTLTKLACVWPVQHVLSSCFKY